MLTLLEIVNHEPSFQSHHSKLSDDFSFLTLSSITHIKPNSIVFMEGGDCLASFLKFAEQRSVDNAYLIIEEGYFKSLRQQEKYSRVRDFFVGVGSVSDVVEAISLISSLFYRGRLDSSNDMVDGRQMGTAKIHPTAQISQNVFIGDGVEVGEGSVIHPGAVIMGHCKIGRRVIICSHVTFFRDVKVGDFCVVQPNSVLGADGFGYRTGKDGTLFKIWPIGGVVIGDHVDIGGGCVIDRGTLGDTFIGSKARLDALLHVSRDMKVKESMVCASHISTLDPSLGHRHHKGIKQMGLVPCESKVLDSSHFQWVPLNGDKRILGWANKCRELVKKVLELR